MAILRGQGRAALIVLLAHPRPRKLQSSLANKGMLAALLRPVASTDSLPAALYEDKILTHLAAKPRTSLAVEAAIPDSPLLQSMRAASERADAEFRKAERIAMLKQNQARIALARAKADEALSKSKNNGWGFGAWLGGMRNAHSTAQSEIKL